MAWDYFGVMLRDLEACSLVRMSELLLLVSPLSSNLKPDPTFCKR